VAQRIVMPSMGMYTEEGVLSAWLRPSGTRVEMGEAIAEITTEKVTFEIPSATAGILQHVAEVGATLRVEQLLGYILAEGETLPTSAEPGHASAHERAVARPRSSEPQEAARASAPIRVSPAARRLASQHGIDLRDVKGSGPGGRIVEADVQARVSKQGTLSESASEATQAEEE
jgi:pyruvate/2-oxoglutarate dehydrogenase complex dihydrolipoamide acyltransferase (E2) component